MLGGACASVNPEPRRRAGISHARPTQLSVTAGMGIIAGMDASSGAPIPAAPSLSDWFATPLGSYLLAREQAWFDRTVADIFGFSAIQIGLPECPFLAQSRVASRWTVDSQPPAELLADARLAAVPGELARPHRAAARTRVRERSAPAPAGGLPRHSRRRADHHLRLQSVQSLRRQALLRPRPIAAVERQLHRLVPAEGLARAAGLRGDGRRTRLLRAAVRERESGGRDSVSSRLPATAGGPSAAACTTSGRRRRSSACASSRRRGSAARTASPRHPGRRASASSGSNERGGRAAASQGGEGHLRELGEAQARRARQRARVAADRRMRWDCRGLHVGRASPSD